MITGLTPVPQSTTGEAPATNNALGKNDFLKMMIAQLSNQDPLSPMEASDFSSQLAQFTSLEQMTNVNANLEKIQNFEAALANASTVNLIGKNIDAPGNGFSLSEGGSKILSYSLDQDAASVDIDIFDSTGKKVATLSLADAPSGNNQIGWGGTDSLGNPVPAGEYTFQVIARDKQSNFVGAVTLTSGLVTDVTFEEDGAHAIVNGSKIAIGQITKVSSS